MKLTTHFLVTVPRAARRCASMGLSCLPLLLPVTAIQAAPPVANTPGEAFRQLNADNWVSREITFAELGFAGPLVLGAPDSRREIYLPVPANVPLSNGEIKLNANYLRADGGRTSLVISLDTYPVSARPFALDKGDASITLGVAGTPRPNGFVRLGLNWDTALGADLNCTDARPEGNVLRIEPDSRFTYRFDASAIRDLTTAWGALPAVPVILISANNLSSESYDSAWRLGVALERAGKRSRTVALPVVGETINLDRVTIPPGLRNLPAFSALAQGGNYKLKDAAEIGALLSLGQSGPFRADIIINDKAMGSAMRAAFDALRSQLQTSAPDAVMAFTEWRTRALDPATPPPVAKRIQLAYAFGRPTIIVASDAGAKAAGLFSSHWNRVALAPVMLVDAANDPANDGKAVSLKYLGGEPGSFDVLAHANWNAIFDIGAVAADGRVPGTLVLDVAAAPSAARTLPVVSIFMNDILLAAKQMDANGKAERITAKIPRYSLAARNTLRVSFVRQLASDRCRETPEAYPVSVLPSSHMLLVKANPSDDFTGMVSRYANGAHVMVPASFLANATATLPRVVRLAATTGVSPINARFTAVSGESIPPPDGPFLALELPLKNTNAKVKLDGGRLVLTGGSEQGNAGSPVLLDVTGLNKIGIVEVIKVGGYTGVAYRNAGSEPPQMEKPLLLSHGDVALIGSNGLISEVSSADPDGSDVIRSEDSPWLLAKGYWWMLPIVAIVFMVALLVFASRMRRRRAADKNKT
ncbi:MAG: hypothetical protein ABI583_10095 [Betaproteobacteria bacterium]